MPAVDYEQFYRRRDDHQRYDGLQHGAFVVGELVFREPISPEGPPKKAARILSSCRIRRATFAGTRTFRPSSSEAQRSRPEARPCW